MRGESSEEEEESRSKIAKMDNLQASMNKVLNELTGMKATVATKDDMRRVSGRLDVLENTQQSMAVSQIEIKKRIEALEKGKPPTTSNQRNSSYMSTRTKLYATTWTRGVPYASARSNPTCPT